MEDDIFNLTERPGRRNECALKAASLKGWCRIACHSCAARHRHIARRRRVARHHRFPCHRHLCHRHLCHRLRHSRRLIRALLRLHQPMISS